MEQQRAALETRAREYLIYHESDPLGGVRGGYPSVVAEIRPRDSDRHGFRSDVGGGQGHCGRSPPHEVDRNLVRAVIKVESNFNPHAVSPKGAMGLIELMPYTARSLNVGNAFENVDAGVRHLKTLLENYNGNGELSRAAPNAGRGAVNPSCGMPPRETRDYVKRIIDLYRDDAFRPRVEETRDAEGHRYFSNNE